MTHPTMQRAATALMTLTTLMALPALPSLTASAAAQSQAGEVAPLAAASSAASAPAQTLPRVEVVGHYQLGLGQSSAASEGSVRASLIEARPLLRAAELLELVPGLIVTQHSGDGKANQYFLRGFNLDHGTDFATWVDGMPVNMVSHAHGQGYSDLNFLIPELVQRIDYRKGPYSAEQGDFSSAGSAQLMLRDRLAGDMATLTLGPNDFRRALVATDGRVMDGQWIAALEAQRNDGPWEVPERLRKTNAVLRYARPGDAGDLSLTLMAYRNQWTATDQVPMREVSSIRLGRFGSLDASDGGRSARLSVSAQGTRRRDDGEWAWSAYAIRSRLNLWSNFTYFLDDPVEGDQFEQAERRRLAGGAVTRRWAVQAAGGDHQVGVGAALRWDRLSPVGLYATRERQRLRTTQESRVVQTALGLHAQIDSRWSPLLRTVVGVRADAVRARVDSSVDGNSGRSDGSRASPKLAVVLGPWRQTELFLNAGHGFHSNDARGTTARLDPKSGDALTPVPSLAGSRGLELGLRGEWWPGLSSSFAVWRLALDSELVYVGDAGTTEPLAASRRHGVEMNHHWALDRWAGAAWRGWQLDVDVAASRARFRGVAAGQDRVPGAVELVGSVGLSWGSPQSEWSGQWQLRHFGPRDLTEDGAQRSRATTLAYLRVQKRWTDRAWTALDVFNVFNRRASDIDYFYASRVSPQAEAVEDRHFHPVEPRSVRLTLGYRW